jgi:hypothetical protein
MAEIMRAPFFYVNLLTGLRGEKVIEASKARVDTVKKTKRPLPVISSSRAPSQNEGSIPP